MKPQNERFSFRVFLGNDKETKDRVYLRGFQWDCNWYWGGGYLEYMTQNNRGWRMHTHFDSIFLEKKYTTRKDYPEYAVWLSLSDILDNAQYTADEWWRIKDLYKQFYALRTAAETFQYGGHCTSKGRNPAEINQDMADRINTHIEQVIIPEIVKALKV